MTVAFRPQGTRISSERGEAPAVRPERMAPPQHDARALTGPEQTAHITLDGMVYILRITRAGKLILTK